MKKEDSPRYPFCPADHTQEKFQIPKLGNSSKFSQFRDNIGEKLGMTLPKLGKFWDVEPLSRSQKRDFLGQYNNYIFKTPFWGYYGHLPNSGEKLGHEFPSLQKYWTKNWENFVSEKIEITIYFGKILGNLKSSLHLSQFFLDLGNVFPKM